MSNIEQFKVKGTIYGIDSGTNVEANPTLEGTEPNLTGLEVDGSKYKIPSSNHLYIYIHKIWFNFVGTPFFKVCANILTPTNVPLVIHTIDMELGINYYNVDDLFLGIDYDTLSCIISDDPQENVTYNASFSGFVWYTETKTLVFDQNGSWLVGENGDAYSWVLDRQIDGESILDNNLDVFETIRQIF